MAMLKHYFQAQKFAGRPWEETVRLAETVRSVLRAGGATP
jgi:hypothetical protein